ncbi:hypothetical protein [Nocardia mikamii]|uniref:hypothetical protein n=1 Tax=Nocardia mikamii TaxID=508464 RepID=UPI0007A4468B|nr:hypothetical protein [Nocardia mikamii]
MKPVERWARVLAGLGGLVAVGLVVLYGLAVFLGGMPDEGAPPIAQRVLLLVKAVVIGVACIALSIGAIIGRPRSIIAGCVLFVADFVLLYVWYSNVFVPPESLPVESETGGYPLEFVLAVWLVWTVLPIVTALLVVAWGGVARGPSVPLPA